MSKKILALIIVCAIIIVGIIVAIICLNVSNEGENEVTENTTFTNEEENTENNTNTENAENESITNENSTEDANLTNENSTENTTSTDEDTYKSGKHHATIKVKNYGTIKLELDADTAPITVSNFAKLVNEGFYDGLTFHRIISGFMIQGGDPLGNGTGGSSETIKGEFSLNGVENNISHTRGVISMARSSSYDSASSQFFIVHEDSTFLDGQYAAFGEVTEGMEVVDKICEDATPTDDNGTISSDEQPIIESITMDD